MGASSKPLIVALDSERKEERLGVNGPLPLLVKTFEAQQSKQRRFRDGACVVKRFRTISTSRNLLEGSKRPRNVVEKQVRYLRKLVPSTESVGLDGLFRDTADYIVDLQLRVKLMQDLVDKLAGSDE